MIGAIGSTGNSTGCHLHVALYKNTPHPFSFSQMTSANAAKFEFDAVYIPNGQKIFVSNSGNDLTGDGSSQNPYYSVQKAVNIATENDSIMIDNGTYTPVVFNGHDVTLVGKGENNTFIDGVNASSCLSILSGETIKIYGMTLQNGNSMNGGAVNIEWGGSCYADSCIIKNSTGQYGGGVSVNNGVFSITNSEIKNNTAIYGGGINAHNNSRIFAQNCKINDNIATTTSISVNTSGGGITCYIGSSAVLINCLGHHNIADYGAFYHGNNSCGLTLINSTISLNRTNKDAAAIEIIDSTMCDIQSSVIWDNHPRQIILSGWNSPRISCASIDYTAIKAGYSGIITNGNILNYGTSNLTSDPLFQDTTALDFTLQPSSPCINSASPDSCENLTQFDLSGNNREIDSYIDRGCYESLISITTGVNDEMKNDRDAIIFPNPSNGDLFITDEFDYIITVCNDANEACPFFSGIVHHRIHKGFEDPAKASGTEEQIINSYRKVRDQLKEYFHEFYSGL